MEELVGVLVKTRLVVVFIIGIMLFLTGLVVPEVHAGGIDIVVAHLYQRIVLCIVGALLAGMPTGLFLWEKVQEIGWEPKQRKRYKEATEREDLETLYELHEGNALRKLKSPDIQEARIGVQEIAGLGAARPFEKGFNALAKELGRRRNWVLKLAIVEALVVVAKPIRGQYEAQED